MEDISTNNPQQLLIKRVIIALIVFFLFVIVKAVISVVAESSSDNIIDCMDCFLNDKSSCIPEGVRSEYTGDSPINVEK